MALKLSILAVLCAYCCANFLDDLHHKRGGMSYRWLEERLQNLHLKRGNKEKPCEHSPADIVFVLDSSSSIWNPHFLLQLQFVNDVIDEFLIGSDMTRIGVETFSDADKVDVRLSLDELENDEAAMKKKIKSIPQRGGNTYTHVALQYMREVMFRTAREGVPHIAIVITDGVSDEPKLTKHQAEMSRDAGITIFAVGVGSADEKELLAIAGNSKQVFKVDSFDMLDELKKQLGVKVCEITTKQPETTTTVTTTTTTTPTTTTTMPQMMDDCDGTMTLDLLLAAPDEAGIRDNEHVMSFFQDIIGELNIGERQSRVGITPRLCGSDEIFRLPPIQLKEHDMKEPLQEAIGDRRLYSTFISQQLEYIMELGFTEEEGGRPNSKKSVVLVVDNKSMFPEDASMLAKEAKALGIHVIVVGVGGYVDKRELRDIASQPAPHNAFFVNSYDQLLGLTEGIKDSLCRSLSA